MDLSQQLARRRLDQSLFGGVREPVSLGRYLLERELGRGGHGVVYRAVDPASERRLAVKLLETPTPGSLARFKLEFRSLCSLVHPNVVELDELHQDGDHWFFSMELIEGSDFVAHVHGSDTAARPSRLRAAFVQLVEGIRAIHRTRKLHRDLKPSNVLVEAGGRVVILDFGLVGDGGHDGRAQDRLWAGTPGYMAPEQAAGSPATEAGDWYAAGLMLYQGLFGDAPRNHCEPGRSPAPTPNDSTARDPLFSKLAALAMDLLRNEPDRRPNSEQILERLDETCLRWQSGAAPDPVGISFRGRARELELLERAFARSIESRESVVVLVSGAPGAGKTALLEEFSRRLPQDVIRLSARCSERESVSFSAVDSLSDALASYLRSLPAERARALLPGDLHCLAKMFATFRGLGEPTRQARVPCDAAEIRRRACAALKELLRRVAEHVRVVIIVDDLEFGDRAGATLLAEVLSAPNSPPALLVCATSSTTGNESRLDTGSLPLTKLVRAETIVLDGLPHDAAVEVSQALGQRLAGLGQEAAAALELIAVAERPLLEVTVNLALELAPTLGWPVWSRELRRRGLARRARGGRIALSRSQLRSAVLDGLDAMTIANRRRRITTACEVTGDKQPTLSVTGAACSSPRLF